MVKKSRAVEETAQIQPEERNLPGIIEVLKANIAAPTYSVHPGTCFTKGQMAFLVEILERVNQPVEERENL